MLYVLFHVNFVTDVSFYKDVTNANENLQESAGQVQMLTKITRNSSHPFIVSMEISRLVKIKHQFAVEKIRLTTFIESHQLVSRISNNSTYRIWHTANFEYFGLLCREFGLGSPRQ